MLKEPNYIEVVSSALGLKSFQIKAVLEMIAEGDSVPFISRYRKERTGELDEDSIREIVDLQKKEENLYKAKNTAINGIEELNLMTPELYENIVNAKTLKEVEEIYKPYKAKKKTKAMIAIEKGFQVVADSIKQNGEIIIPDELLKEYSREEIIEGSIYIISAEIVVNASLRDILRDYLLNKGVIISKIKSKTSLEKLNEKDRGQVNKFDIYSDFSIQISNLKPYQILALNRGENLKILNVKIEKQEVLFDKIMQEYANILSLKTAFIPELLEAFTEGYNALFKSVENEVRSMMNEIGEDDAIKTFSSNLGALLLTKPEYGKTILAIDPGYRAGCKMVVLDKLGNPEYFDKIFLNNEAVSKTKLLEIISKYKPGVIVVGNGTGVNETVEILQDITTLEIYIVNESGASVYSASKTAKEEFPDLDVLDRGTVSIGRRYIDPLSELVKVPVESIGVGMYQHDMPVKKLEEKLGFVVEDVVNEVGINVNLASSFVLNHISGIDKRGAKKIYNNRPYKSRKDLKKQLSGKAYEQAVGFLRVPESKEELDNTDIHPDQYKLAKYVIDNGIYCENFDENFEVMTKLYPDVTLTTVGFIIDSYNEMGEEKRVNSTHKKASGKIDIETIKEGDILEGVIRNVVAFGAFVDIGLKNDGLVHISQLADGFVKDPMEVVEVGQKVKVKLTGIDSGTGKIQLSMKDI